MYLMPKERHVRKYRPPLFKRYQSFKRFLQHEFVRTCVYCRQFDTLAPSLAFHVDHYRPQGRPEFAHLSTTYSNLFYCCPACNSRKKAYWPLTAADDRILNPCDDVMAEHLRFDAATGMYEPRSRHGAFMVDLLQLNDEEVVKFRRAQLANVRLLQRALDQNELERGVLAKQLAKGAISPAEHAADLLDIDSDDADLREMLAIAAGTKPPMPLPRRGWLPA